MDNLRKFATEADYSAATLNYPAVSWVVSSDTVHYDKEVPTPSFQGKWFATYSGSHTESAACDSTSAITENEITLTNLVSVEIGDCVTSIGDNAFADCESLTSCTIGSGVTSIGESAFDTCESLTSVTVNATTPPTLGGFAFLDTNDCPIYVPSASLNAYQSASGWSFYADRIQAIPS